MGLIDDNYIRKRVIEVQSGRPPGCPKCNFVLEGGLSDCPRGCPMGFRSSRMTSTIVEDIVDYMEAYTNGVFKTRASNGKEEGDSKDNTKENQPSGNTESSVEEEMIMEKLRLCTKAGKVKTGGAIMCLAGALTISLYKDVYSPRFCVLGFGYLFCCRGAVCAIEAEWTWTNVCPDDFAGGSWFTMLAMVDSHLLLGMLLIVSGLYSFLWGKNKESKIMVLPKAIFDETSLVVVVPDQSVVKQSTGVVMPSASTSISTIDAEDGADPNHGEVHGV
ncbi:hypothetical protein TEA_025723 [Camellia sinensis var. sinensis]|uniref:Uncharacterized protein n=1 Tax=Camellia sinensis var. sinensis TaxID=542762 RepID=A0A4S4EL15_CAMSN|nr:hypothetical protein TEA_025723 [Camellia sinensis var. sinensis]